MKASPNTTGDWRCPSWAGGKHVYPGPAWDGSDARGKTLLVYAEQGLGDGVQFARFATSAAERGARVILTCQPALCTLLATVSGVEQVVAGDAALPRYDAHVALLSLPHALRIDLASIPSRVPYISVPQPRRDAVRAVLALRTGFKVGIAWAGNKGNSDDRKRSLALTTLAPLFDVPGVDWYSLQHGEPAGELAALPGAHRMAPLAPTMTLADTAALVAELDLVISVDTVIAHLAGALARPCWVMLAFAADWRWLRGEQSPWYPTARLFRQSAPRDWSGVVTRLVAELESLTRR